MSELNIDTEAGVTPGTTDVYLSTVTFCVEHGLTIEEVCDPRFNSFKGNTLAFAAQLRSDDVLRVHEYFCTSGDVDPDLLRPDLEDSAPLDTEDIITPEEEE